ncbi:MAG: phosphotransferase [Bacteroidetes bacterium]|nr:phosphotransferase [Bacteroidota bacterium]
MKDFFPASYSTLSSSALAGFIQNKYGLGSVDCQLILRGVGDTYGVNSHKGRYILRAYRPDQRSLSEITAEVDLLLGLKERGVPVSWPIADRSGACIQAVEAVEGVKHLVLFSYAPGQSVSRLSDGQLHQLGFQMARFHEAARTIELKDRRWTFDQETTLFGPLKGLEPAFVETPEGYEWMQRMAEKAGKKMKELNADSLPAGVCHYDFLPKNFHFDGDKLTFFDFDFFGHGLLANDLMSFWQQLRLDTHFKRMTKEEADAAFEKFLNGYREIRTVSKRELAIIPWLGLGWWLFYGAFHTTHDQFYPIVQPAHFKLRVDLMRSLLEPYLA